MYGDESQSTDLSMAIAAIAFGIVVLFAAAVNDAVEADAEAVAEANARAACVARGGAWKVTGRHFVAPATYTPGRGGVGIPLGEIREVPEYGCVEPGAPSK